MFLASLLPGRSGITSAVQIQIRESRIQPVWHVLVLTLLTAGWYVPFWFYKTCRDLARRASQSTDDSFNFLTPLTISEAAALRYVRRCYPILLALGTLVPYLRIFVSAFVFKTAAQLYPHTQSPVRKHPVLAALILAAVYATAMGTALPGVMYFLYLLIVVPIAVVQHWLNKYWLSVEPDDVLVRQSFSATELVLLLFGIVLTGMLILHFFYGV